MSKEFEDFPKTIQDVFTPCFLVDIDKVKRNAQNMIERCHRLGVKLRPHMKTHKTVEAGDIMTGGSRRCIEVSTLNEAEFYADSGYDDILYGCSIIQPKMERCKQLESRLSEFHVMFDSQEGLTCLESTPLQDGKKWSAYLEIDTGTGRAGVAWDSDEATDLAKRATGSKNVTLKGLYTYDGNTYLSQGETDIKQTSKRTFERVLHVSRRLEKVLGFRPGMCQGSTPSLSHPDASLAGLTECTPGNYVFYDLTQCRIGSCSLEDVACRVATRVLCHRPELNQMCIDCGFLGLSQDGFKLDLPNGPCLFQDNPYLKYYLTQCRIGSCSLDDVACRVATRVLCHRPELNQMCIDCGFLGLSQDGFKLDLPNGPCLFQDNPHLKLVAVSQEIGQVTSTNGAVDFDKYPVGSILFVYPNHSCATAAMYGKYYIHKGDDVIGTWVPTRGW